MAKIFVFYTEHEDELAPIWMIVRFGRGNIQWDKTNVYIPVTAPFKRLRAEDFHDEVLGLSIAQTEMILHPEQAGKFGIHLPAVLKRIDKMRGEEFAMPFLLEDIEQFIIQMADIEEVLQMSVIDLYAWE
ncbi:hypothetical protein [Paenibacillus contaminans]|uniref:Uncharacterized protein n=1 Tax=Paenibacillus contaminans TaxID=450362 RepID=A0A329MFX8_9BACL|nr:hypothetical protein [Paenibacillus contaminans]RAV18851.1 hypothetical protein DQG23_24290 [Paenibacillus contaminans]